MKRRIGMAVAALTSVTGVVLLTAGIAASAGKGTSQKAGAERPSNNGTVKIHDGADEPSPVTRNEPHVCHFHIDFHGFDPHQDLSFEVLSWQPTGDGSTVLTGTITADSAGNGRAPEQGAYYSLRENGHYRLVVDTGNGTPTQDKHKMFWVDCPSTDSPDNGGGTLDTPTPSTSPAGVVLSSPDSPTSPSSSGSTGSAGSVGSAGRPGTLDSQSSPSARAAATTTPSAGPNVGPDAAAGLVPPQPEARRLSDTGVSAVRPITTVGAAMLVVGLVLTFLSRRRPPAPRRGR